MRHGSDLSLMFAGYQELLFAWLTTVLKGTKANRLCLKIFDYHWLLVMKHQMAPPKEAGSFMGYAEI